MKWVQSVVNTIKPDFGGIATFCENPDGILDMPEVREAIRAAGMRIIDWDGTPEALSELQQLNDDDMPVVVVPDTPLRHVVHGILSAYVWQNISIGGLFSKFNVEVVKSVPREHWDELRTLHQMTRVPQSADETAILIARAIYGVDPLHLEVGDGWMRTLKQVAGSGEPIPGPVSRTLTRNAPGWLGGAGAVDLMTDPAAAKGALAVLGSKSGKVETQPSIKETITAAKPTKKPTKPIAVIDKSDSAESVLDFGLDYCQRVAQAKIDVDARIAANDQFSSWLEANYPLVLSSQNPKVLRSGNLLARLDAEFADEPLLLIVVDGLGLAAWDAVEKVWREAGVISGARTRAAFAVIPTLTSLSRRAIFEAKPPSQFTSGDHSSKLERSLWIKRYGRDGAYASSSEALGIADAFALAKKRVAVVDTDWDKLVHSLDPKYGTLAECAASWASKTDIRGILSLALKSGYRVVLTADHGEVECVGIGRPKSGELTDERSKRVLLFPNQTLRDGFMSDSYNNYLPPGLPPGCFPLFTRQFGSFDQPDIRCFSHGGLSMEEVLVPVAEVFSE